MIQPIKVIKVKSKKAATLIKNAKRPLIIAGAGVLKSGAMDELKELAEKAQIPVTNTLVGLGGFPGDHELALGMVGMHGSVAANNSTDEADLVIAAGIRFHDRITGHPDFFCKKLKSSISILTQLKLIRMLQSMCLS